MTTYNGYSGSENTTVGIAESWKPGDATDPSQWVNPTSWLMVENDGLTDKPNQISRDVQGAGRDADVGHRTGKHKVGGNLQIGLYPNNGFDLLVGAIGNTSSQTAVPSVTSTAVASANGTTTFTVPSTAGFVKGRPALIDAAPNQEPMILIDMTATTLVFPQCSLVHASGCTILQPVADLVAPYSKASGFGNLLRRYCVEEAPGGKYGNRYAGGFVGKWALKAAAAKFDVTADLVFSVPRDTANHIPMDLDETVGGWGELGFEFTDGFLAFPADPGSTGTAVLQLVGDGQDWDLSIDNKMREIGCFDNTNAYKNFPGTREVQAGYTMLNQANRPVAYTDFVLKQINVPWFAQVALNTGTPATPKWQIETFYMPNARFLDAEEVKSGNTVVGEKVTIRALKGGGLEKLYVYRVTM